MRVLYVSACNFACASNTASIAAEKEQFDKNFRLAQHEARATALKEIQSSESVVFPTPGGGFCPIPGEGIGLCYFSLNTTISFSQPGGGI